MATAEIIYTNGLTNFLDYDRMSFDNYKVVFYNNAEGSRTIFSYLNIRSIKTMEKDEDDKKA